MSSQFINGAKYAVSSQMLAAAIFTAISNAAEAVVSATAPPVNGSIVVLKSGWTELNETVARTEGATANTFVLSDVDTTDQVRYPAGEGAGTFLVASDFVGLSQVRDVAMEGGDQNYFQFQYVEDQGGRQRQSPTFKSAMAMTITLDYDADLPWYQSLITLDRLREPVVLRETLPGGDVIYYYGMLAFNKVPTKGINENMTVLAAFSLMADPIRYPAI